MLGLAGGDEDEGARLQRNFHERGEVEKDISTMKVYEMYYLGKLPLPIKIAVTILAEYISCSVFKPFGS